MDYGELSKDELIERLIAANEKLHERDTLIRDAHARYQSLFEYSGDSILVVDHNTTQILDANDNAARRLGYTKEELIDLTIDQVEIIDTDGASADEAMWRSTFSGTTVYEASFKRRDGSLIPVEVSSRITKQDDNLIIQYFVRDITWRKEAEQVIAERNTALRTLNDIALEIGSDLDMTTVLRRIIDRAVDLLTANLGGAIYLLAESGGGLHIAETAALNQSGEADGLAIAEPVMQRAVNHGHSLIESTQKRSILAVPLVSAEQIVGVLGLVADEETHNFTGRDQELAGLFAALAVTAIQNAQLYQQAQEEIVERGKLIADLDAFAHTVAHDLKNPIGVIIGYAEFLSEEVQSAIQPTDTMRHYFRGLMQGALKMESIIDELLLLASLRRNEDVETSTLDTQAVVTEALARFVIDIEQRKAVIEQPPDANWHAAVGYAPWVEEVWSNYISNALKYGGKPPILQLGSDLTEDGEVRFWVRDNGKGLSSDKLTLVFEQFSRFDDYPEGQGLGLSIVKRIVDRLGGRVGVESEEGRGSTFWFTLPPA